MTPLFAAARATRAPSNPRPLPFGWGAPTALLVGAVLTIIGILLILWGMLGFFSGTIGNATSGNFSISTFFQGFFGAIMLFVIGGVLAGAGGWLIRLWWIFLFIDMASGNRGGDTVRAREEMRAGDVHVRCRACGRLNPESAKFCMSCAQPV